jgi:hypothetical protein
MPDDNSPVESKPKQGIARDAEVLISKMSEVEALLGVLSPTATSDDSVAQALTRGLDALDCLRIAAIASAYPDTVANALTEAGADKSVVEQIRNFGARHNLYGTYLNRLHRSEQGFVNEFTRIVSRPTFNLIGATPELDIEIYSHDRLLVTAKNELDGLASFVSSLLGAMNRAAEKLNGLSPSLARGSLDEETITEIVKRADRLRELIPPIVNQESK